MFLSAIMPQFSFTLQRSVGVPTFSISSNSCAAHSSAPPMTTGARLIAFCTRFTRRRTTPAAFFDSTHRRHGLHQHAQVLLQMRRE
ncbi:UNVERIFIED_CONTAM: hypothetical protein Sangu_1045800 [Sesamum angustifolium]|uniref:Uncharacterized protein n=1 Tax=Sesamum angustifolium TaxID=2727405 RepID=A0AAW2NWE6_9LAMI